tara:strand:+ start:624 stop:1016 length:393 start_codon:yes stop_codon:yes gene_type:complete
MIQRVQSLLFFFSAICSITIVYTFPVLQDETTSYLLKEHFQYARLFVFLSAAFSIFAIFQFKNRKRQQLIASFSRLMITIAVFLIVFLHREEKVLGLGMILLIVPFFTLVAANFFINRDEKLVKSADRIR